MLVVFGALFVLLFAGFAIAQGGIGQPSVPSGDVALVQNVPSDVGNISEAAFKGALAHQVAESETKKAPKPGSKKAEELKEAALGELLDAAWIAGEAEELSISVTPKQIETELAQIKKTNFPTPASFKEFLKTSGFSEEDVNDKVELQLLSTQIQEQIAGETSPPSNAEIAANYEETKAAQYTTKASRDVRVIINENKGEVEKALQALEADNSPANWKVVAPKYSSDPTTNKTGGLQKALTEELLASAGPLKGAIFGAATNELVGPIKFQKNYVVLEVVKLNPEKVQSLGEVRSQISTTLTQEKQQTFFAEFVSEYESKWTSRTFCASGFVTKRCANFKGSGHPEGASAACYEGAKPKKKGQKEEAALECPAAVEQIKPAIPGSVTRVKPTGEQLVQRPRPEGLAEAGAEGTTELPEGATEVPAPTGE
ncbi:MAG: peptidyl-prolyl cis-trans isomerase [Solirubrobacterales bacterium]|nr:peptidyl-prolyl cis-trans isomerase [Solirubrobacterales bacterium]